MRPHPILSALLWATLTAPAWAQSIIPAADGTGTLVMPDGSTYQITGGTLSGDGVNLFHSFEQFGLTAAEVANFLADPTVQNILGRVVGGNASVIDGLLQVSGSSANLYLLNPAGILFGPNSALNLDGSFTATTASGVGFGENWLPALGDANYAALTGNPTAFAFGSEPGALINLGNLAVNPGEVITLASGSVINLGTLTAPGGQIIVLAVPGENRVSIRPEGALLSLELATLPEEALSTAPLPFSPLDIPSLLRAGGPEVATGITHNPDGTVILTSSTATLPTTPGTALVSGTLDVVGGTGGEVQVLGDRIAITAATIDASGTQGGGTVLIGGEYQGGGTTPTSDRTYVDANSTITADALNTGNGGEIIVWADETNRFYGQISAQGGANGGDGGFAEVSGRDYLDFAGTVDLSAPQGLTGTLLLDPTNIEVIAGANNPAELAANDEFADPGVNSTIANSTINAATANVVLQATNNITVNAPVSIAAAAVGFTATADNNIAINFSLATNGGDITLNGDQNLDGVGSVSLNAGSSLLSNGGNMTITGRGGGTPGVNLSGASLNAGGGNIAFDGTASDSSGVAIGNNSSLQTSGAGNITLNGTGAGTGNFQYGVFLFGNAGGITTENGTITLTGTSNSTGGGSSRGIEVNQTLIQSVGGNIGLNGRSNGSGDVGVGTNSRIQSTNGTISITGGSIAGVGVSIDNNLGGQILQTTGVGDIIITDTGSGLNPGIGLGNPLGLVTVQTTGSGNITLVTDNPVLNGATISGRGNLQIRPLTPSLPIILGGNSGSAIAFLNQNEIAQLGNGFSSRTIGQVGNTGTVTLEPFTLSSPLTIAGGLLAGPNQDTTFSLVPDGSLEVGGFGAPLVLLNPTEIIGGLAVNTVLGGLADDTFTVTGDGTGLLGTIRFSNISAFDGGAGFDAIAGTVANDYFVVNSSSGGYTLDSDFLPDISFTNVEQIAAGGGAQDVVELVGVPLDLAVSGGSGTLSVASQGSVTLNADVTTPGDLVISASAGDVAQTSGEVTVGGNTSLDAPVNITLNDSNDFNTVTVTTGQNVTLNDRNSLQLNELTFSGELQVTAGGDLTATTNLQPGDSTPLSDQFTADISILVADSTVLATDSLAGISLTSGGSLTTADITALGAPIALDAGGAITTGNLNSSGSTGGSVRLEANRIQVNSINAQGTTSGGTITALTPSTFRAVGSFTDQNGIAASLSTVGGSRGGAVMLGYGASTFTLGDPSFNGTLAAITTGDVTLLPDLANPILGGRIFGRGLPGQVQFISLGEIPVEIEPPLDEIDPFSDPNRPLETVEEDAPVFLTSAGNVLGQEQLSEAEDSVNSDFAGYFGDLIKSPRSVNLEQARATLHDIAAQTGAVPAFMYVRLNRDAKPGEGGVELLLITAEGEPTRVRVLNTTAEEVLKTQEQLRRQITNPNLTNNTAYLGAAQQLYGWLIAPIEAELKAAGVNNIGFVMDAGLRTLPLAALHNGERFLIEDYSFGLIPSLGLIDPTYVDLNRQNSTLLVSGASQFINQPPLLAAEVEMQTLQTLWPSTKVAETSFTVGNLQRDRRQSQIIHMATHAQFLRGAPDNSYLQFFDRRLRLNQVPDLGWFDPQVELVTLSACQTAMGNADAELGFAGFALLAGAKSALASLWKVNDEATAGLMIAFYQSLDDEAIKAAALRDAQLAMVRGEIYTENGQLVWPGGSLALPPDLVIDGRQDLSHPFYWAAFTMVGSPW